MSKKTLYYTHNNAFDSIVLAENGKVLSEWTVDRKIWSDYLETGADPDLWDEQDRDGLTDSLSGEPLKVKDYGKVLGENGKFYSQEDFNERRRLIMGEE